MQDPGDEPVLTKMVQYEVALRNRQLKELQDSNIIPLSGGNNKSKDEVRALKKKLNEQLLERAKDP